MRTVWQHGAIILKALRPHHWFKNLLLAIPWVMAHQWKDPKSAFDLLIAIIAFSLIASAIYIYNDLFDLPADRRHPIKKKRPIASGALPAPRALAVGLFLTVSGFILGGFTLPWPFLWLLVAYSVVAVVYSAVLKRYLVLDVIVLAGLYAFRIFAGGAVVEVQVSAWLLAFSVFFFLSLAFAKRYLDLSISQQKNGENFIVNRPYTTADLAIFRIAGPNCGLLSVLVLALYINSHAVQTLYKKPYLLWFLCPLFLYWILRTWVLVLRGEAASDPVVFALRDRASLVVAVLIAFVLFIAI